MIIRNSLVVSSRFYKFKVLTAHYHKATYHDIFFKKEKRAGVNASLTMSPLLACYYIPKFHTDGIRHNVLKEEKRNINHLYLTASHTLTESYNSPYARINDLPKSPE